MLCFFSFLRVVYGAFTVQVSHCSIRPKIQTTKIISNDAAAAAAHSNSLFSNWITLRMQPIYHRMQCACTQPNFFSLIRSTYSIWISFSSEMSIIECFCCCCSAAACCMTIYSLLISRSLLLSCVCVYSQVVWHMRNALHYSRRIVSSHRICCLCFYQLTNRLVLCSFPFPIRYFASKRFPYVAIYRFRN